MAAILCALSRGSSSRSSTSEPGEKRTSVALRNPPSNAVARIVAMCLLMRLSTPSPLRSIHRQAGRVRPRRRWSLLRMVFLLHDVHATISLGEQFFCVLTIVRIDCHSRAQRYDFLAAEFTACLGCDFSGCHDFLVRRVGLQPRRNDYEFITAHSCHVVVLAAGIF